ncbi:beta-ketoacyl synthase N-terminal-like domain-containing protein [Streptomyces sp. NPDC055607]
MKQPHAGMRTKADDARDVVVTGLGVVAGDRPGPEALFAHLAGGGSLITRDPRMEAWGLPGGVSASVPGFLLSGLRRQVPADARPLSPAGALGWYAATRAWANSGLGTRTPAPGRTGVFVACNRTMGTEEDFADLTAYHDAESGVFDLDAYLDGAGPRPDRDVLTRPDSLTSALAARYGAGGAAETRADACAAGAMAVASAYRHIREGSLDVALAGGAEALTSFAAVVGFLALGALALGSSADPAVVSRPFDKSRTGFVIGDAGAFLVLESREHAARRGARVRARVEGCASVAEAVRVTASSPDGARYADCMRQALEDAGVGPEDVDHVNAHGTATRANDVCEAAALVGLFGERVRSLPLTANKSATGHSLAGSGAVEAVLSVLTLERQVLLPTLNFEAGDDVTSALDVVTAARPARVSRILSNSFGFGGENCSLVLAEEHRR